MTSLMTAERAFMDTELVGPLEDVTGDSCVLPYVGDIAEIDSAHKAGTSAWLSARSYRGDACLSATYILMLYFSCSGGSCGSPQNVAVCVAPQIHNLIVRCDGKNDAAQFRPQHFPSLQACTGAAKAILNPAANPGKTVVSYKCIKR